MGGGHLIGVCPELVETSIYSIRNMPKGLGLLLYMIKTTYHCFPEALVTKILLSFKKNHALNTEVILITIGFTA